MASLGHNELKNIIKDDIMMINSNYCQRYAVSSQIGDLSDFDKFW